MKIVILLLSVFILTTGLKSEGEVLKNLKKAPIVKVGLFKNNVITVSRKLEIPAGKKMLLVDAGINAIYGTLRVEFQDKYSVSVSRRKVLEKAKERQVESSAEILKSFIGKKVTIVLKKKEKVIGTIKEATSKYVFLASATATEVIPVDKIQRFSVFGAAFNPKKDLKPVREVKKRVLTVNVKPSDKRREMVITYLTRGMSWSPNYKLELMDGKGVLSMDTVIKNDMEDLKNCKIYLISGYPSMEHSRKNSLFSLINIPVLNRALSRSQAMSNTFTVTGVNLNDSRVRKSKGGSDMHYMYAGMHSVKKKGAVLVNLAIKPLKVSRRVEWDVEDSYDPSGKREEEIWDYIKFRNPFDFPMTTAPISIYHEGDFLSQHTVEWVPEGEEASVKSSRTLNVKAEYSSTEDITERKTKKVNGVLCNRSTMIQTYTLRNLRSTEQSIVVKDVIMGKIKSIEGNPKVTHAGLLSDPLNVENEVEWKLKLKPGEKKKITCRYQLLSKFEKPE